MLSLVLVGAVGSWSELPQRAVDATQTAQSFDGKWWSKTSVDEHSGFINGAADCLTWTEHEKGFNATPEQLVDKIDRVYKEHPESSTLNVIEIWKNLRDEGPINPGAAQRGETWKNAHWYLDGFWWVDDTPDQKQGFVEGYLWCMRSHVRASTERYSKPASFYVEKIDGFTKAHSETKANREKVALILWRYKDSSTAATPKWMNSGDRGSDRRR